MTEAGAPLTPRLRVVSVTWMGLPATALGGAVMAPLMWRSGPIWIEVYVVLLLVSSDSTTWLSASATAKR